MVWEQVTLPYVFEGVIAFSIPENDQAWVMSDEEVHKITLSPEVSVETDRDRVEDHDASGPDMLGLYGGHPILEDPEGLVLHLETKKSLVTILDAAGDTQGAIEYEGGAGGWTVATFSKDFKYIVIGTPHDLHVFKRQEAPGSESFARNTAGSLKKKPRLVLASLVAVVVMFLPAVWSPPSAEGPMLVVSFIFLAFLMLAVGYVLQEQGMLSVRSLLVLTGGLSLASGLLAMVAGQGSLKDQTAVFLSAFLLSFGWYGLGAATWWLVAFGGITKVRSCGRGGHGIRQ